MPGCVFERTHLCAACVHKRTRNPFTSRANAYPKPMRFEWTLTHANSHVRTLAITLTHPPPTHATPPRACTFAHTRTRTHNNKRTIPAHSLTHTHAPTPPITASSPAVATRSPPTSPCTASPLFSPLPRSPTPTTSPPSPSASPSTPRRTTRPATGTF